MTGTILGFLKGLFNLSGTNPPAAERTYDITSLEELRGILELRTDDPVYNGPWTANMDQSKGTRELCLIRRDYDLGALQPLQSALYQKNIGSSIVFLPPGPDRHPAIKVYGNDARTLIDLLRASNGWLLKYGEKNSPLKAFTSIAGLAEDFGVPVDEWDNELALRALSLPLRALSLRTPVFLSVAPEVLTAYVTKRSGFGQDAPLRPPLRAPA